MYATTTLTKPYLTVKDISTYLNVSQSQAYSLTHRKDFPISRFGGAIRIPKEPFLSWVAYHSRISCDLPTMV